MPSSVAGALQRAHAGRAHAHYPPSARPRRVNARGRIRGHLPVLGVHLVILDVLLLDRAERAQPHMQQYRHYIYALGRYALQQFGREVQPRRGRGRRAVLARIHRLIARGVLQLFVYVRRQRHLAQRVQQFLEHALILEPDRAHAAPRLSTAPAHAASRRQTRTACPAWPAVPA